MDIIIRIHISLSNPPTFTCACHKAPIVYATQSKFLHTSNQVQLFLLVVGEF